MKTKFISIVVSITAICLLTAGLATAADGTRTTPLDEYVRKADPAYEYHLVRTLTGKDYTAFVLEMTSQSWRSLDEVDRTLWKHWLTVYRPNNLSSKTALLFIGGGRNEGAGPEKPDENHAGMAEATESVVAELRMVPNQPLTYKGDSFGPRVEDELIAYNWDRYLATKDANWLTRLPMTKSAVRAMDAVTDFLKSEAGGGKDVSRFVVAGGSKRGWTAWTTAAVDERVEAVVPIVIDLLNLKKSFIHHYRVYGFWAPAVKDYFDMGIMDRMSEPGFENLVETVEPYSYRERYTMPKFIVNSAGDQFFLPDSSQFYFDDLPGETYLRYVPNSDHSLRRTDALESITAFYDAVLKGCPRPRFDFRNEGDGAIRVTTEDKPSAVKLWKATNPRHRDFRLESVGPIYQSEDLAPESGGVYVGRVQKPAQGWTAFFIELTYPSGMKYPFKFTTGVNVIPDALPFDEPVPGKTKIGPRKQ
jgi:PhoPQ-activated pathogenicity-related protein